MWRLIALATLAAGCPMDGRLHRLEDADRIADEPEDAEAQPALSLTPAVTDFGVVPLGGVAAAMLTAKNTGDFDIDLTDLNVDGSAAFSMTALDGDLTLAPGESVHMEVAFSPDTSGEATAEVFARSRQVPTQTASLIGAAPGARLLIDPRHTDLGKVDLDSSFEWTGTLQNVGDASTTVTGLALAGSPEFQITSAQPPPFALAPGQGLPISVAFLPVDIGPEEASLTATSADAWVRSARATIEATGADLDPVHATIIGTADDEWELYIDGKATPVAGADYWGEASDLDHTFDPGEHVLAIYAKDRSNVISGLRLHIQDRYGPVFSTGVDDIKASAIEPTGDWTAPGYDDSSWDVAERCSDTSPWADYPSTMRKLPAEWVWTTRDCKSLGQAWFRLHLRID